MSRTWCSSFGIEALRGELSDEFVVGRGSRFGKLCLRIEGCLEMFGIHGLFIVVSFIHALLPSSWILNLPGGGTQLTRRRDASSGLVVN